MAGNKGLFADFGSAGTVEAQRKLLLDEQRAQFERLIQNAPTARERAAGGLVEGLVGLGQAGVFGDTVQDRLEPTSPDLERARSDAEIAKEVAGFEEDPTSAAHSRRVAELAKAKGRDDLAIRALIQAGERTKSEKKLKLDAERAVTKERREQFKQFPTAVQEEIIARSPEQLVSDLGIDTEKATKISAAVEERNAFQRAKAKKELEDVTKVTATKITGADVAATVSLVDTLTNGEFEGEPELETVSRLVADRAQTMANALKDAGQPIDMTDLRAQAFQKLQDEGVVTFNPGEEVFGAFNVGEKLEVDPKKLSAPSGRRRVILK